MATKNVIKKIIKDGVEYFIYSTKGEVEVDSALSDTSENPVQNKVVKGAIDGKITNPSGGTAGQYLKKNAQGEEWADVDALPSGGTVGQVLTKTQGGADWEDATGSDYTWVTKTISSGEVELGLRTIVNAPGSNFTLTAPSSLKEGEEYVIRVINEANYTMTLGTGFTNPFSVDLSLSYYATDQFVFVAVGGNLELQPLFNN